MVRKLLLSALLLSYGNAAMAGIYSWRNGGNGDYTDATPPLDWESEANLLWRADLGNWSNSCPIVVSDRIIFGSEPTTLVCLDKKSGELLWQRTNSAFDLLGLSPEERENLTQRSLRAGEIDYEIRQVENRLRRLERSVRKSGETEELKASIEEKKAEIASLKEGKSTLVGGTILETLPPDPRAHSTNGYSSYTPVSDGRHVFAAFGTGVIVAFDLEGNRLWSKTLEPPDHDWGGSTSPLLIDGKLIVRFADFVALDPKDGSELWRVATETQFGTSATFEVEKHPYLFTARGEIIDVESGRKLLEAQVPAGKKQWAYFNTPFVHEEAVFVVRGDEDSDSYAYRFRIPGTREDLESAGVEVIWKSEAKRDRYYSSPVLHDGVLYVLTRRHFLTAYDADSGEVAYTKDLQDSLKGSAYPSLTITGDYLFLASDEGTVLFLEPGREYKEVARSSVDEFRSTPVFMGDTAYLRSLKHLYALKSR